MKKIFIFAFSIIYLLSISLGFSYALNKPNTLVVHYFRYDGNYNNYNMWVWQNLPVGLDGIQHNFDPLSVDQYGVSYSIDIETDYADSQRLGIIIKQGGWDGYREPGGDRFIDLDQLEVTNGVAHVYFVQGQIDFGKSQADLENNIPDYRPSILFTAFNAQSEITLSLSHPATSYKVFENSVEIKTGTFSNANLSQKITSLNIDITKKYEVEVSFGASSSKKIVSLQNLYDTEVFEDAFTYEGELGVIYAKNASTFRLWAPVSESVVLNTYQQGHPNYDRLGNESLEDTPLMSYPMTQIENGVWEVTVDGDLASKYYTFSVTNNGVTQEVTDPYSYSTGANGLRSMVVDFEQTNPSNWNFEERPATIKTFTDYIIWELHVRDLTSHSSWNGSAAYRGKFLGIAETGTTYTQNGVTVTTGLDHIEELGVNAVHLLPIFDFGYIDEVEVFKNPNQTNNVFNWGYMPYHYNTLEGSYATNPFDGNVRIYEFKKTVQAFHSKNIRVIMDVVYNHTGESEGSNFHKIVPGYYHRLNAQGGFSNGSGTGNETASERSMVRKLFVDSTIFLAKEYKLSGFRFDLMSLHDIETMNTIREEMNKIDPTIILYGEPWAGGDTLIKGEDAAGMTNTNEWDRTQIRKLDSGVAAFNDLYRNALKGQPDGSEGGFVQGNMNVSKYNDLKAGIKGATDQFTNSPLQNIVYGEAHDNLTLHDKLRSSGVTANEVQHAQVQSNAVVLTSMGIPFLHAGTEFLRSKPKQDGTYEHNSYESPDSVNQLRWDRKITYLNAFEYHKALIHLRKSISAFRLDTIEAINNRFTFIETTQSQTFKALAYHIEGTENEPSVLVMHVGKLSGITGLVLNDGKTYNQVTSRAGTQGLFDTQSGLVTRSGTFQVATSNTSAIFVEVMDAIEASVKEAFIEVAKDAQFDPLSNMNLPVGAKVYATPIQTNLPGFKVVTVSVIDYLGNTTYYYYNIRVSGQSFQTVLGGL